MMGLMLEATRAASRAAASASSSTPAAPEEHYVSYPNTLSQPSVFNSFRPISRPADSEGKDNQS